MNETRFLFSEEQEMYRDTVARLAQAEFRDGYLERATSSEYPRDALKLLARNGLLSLAVPESLGGQGADAVTMGIAIEELARADFNVSYVAFNSILTGGLVSRLLPADERTRWAQGVARGDRVVCAGFTEPRGGSDLQGLRLRAERDGDGWRLTGEKTSVTTSPHSDAAIILATTDASKGSRGTVILLVDMDDPTVSLQKFRDPGFRPQGRAGVTFDGTYVPRSRQMGEIGEGFKQIMREFELSRTLLGLMCVGTARRAMEMTVEWVKQREAFGQPISKFQGVSFPLAEHDTYLEASRWLAYRSLALRDAGRSHNREAAMCKWWMPQISAAAINDCIILHGHTGWAEEMPLTQMLKDVSGLQIGDGTPQIQKLVIARSLIGREWV
jgi:cyclohexanecarboxyl-CoA dehydrogenase